MNPEPSIAAEELHTDLVLFLHGEIGADECPLVIIGSTPDLSGLEHECTVIHKNGTLLELRCSASMLGQLAALNRESKCATQDKKPARSATCGGLTCVRSKNEDGVTTTEQDVQLQMDGFAE